MPPSIPITVILRKGSPCLICSPDEHNGLPRYPLTVVLCAEHYDLVVEHLHELETSLGEAIVREFLT